MYHISTVVNAHAIYLDGVARYIDEPKHNHLSDMWLLKKSPYVAYPCELRAHLLCFFDETSLQHVLGTLRVDEAVGSVQGLSLIHPPSCFLYVAGMLQSQEGGLEDVDRVKTPTDNRVCRVSTKPCRSWL